jgi:hypothetical protein
MTGARGCSHRKRESLVLALLTQLGAEYQPNDDFVCDGCGTDESFAIRPCRFRDRDEAVYSP